MTITGSLGSSSLILPKGDERSNLLANKGLNQVCKAFEVTIVDADLLHMQEGGFDCFPMSMNY